MTGQIHKAVGQLDAGNPAREHLSVLAIVNGDDEAGMTDLISSLTGNAYCESGALWPMFREYSEGRIRADTSAGTLPAMKRVPTV